MSERGRLVPGNLDEYIDRLGQREIAELAQPLGAGELNSSWLSRYLDPPQIRDKKFKERSPTYKTLTDKVDPRKLYFDLSSRGAIDAKLSGELGEGYYVIQGLDQFALSGSSSRTVTRLIKSGYGLWPTDANLEPVVGTYHRLGVELTEQQAVLISPVGNEGGGLWWKQRRLKASDTEFNVMYLPTVLEVASAFSNFYDQEGSYPDSQSKWFLTASRVPIDLADSFRRIVADRSASQIFIDACIPYALDEDLVWKYINKPGNFSIEEDEFIVENKNRKFSIRDFDDNESFVLYRSPKGIVESFYFEVEGEDYWQLKNRVFNTEDAYEDIRDSISLATIEAEIEDQKAKTQTVLEKIKSASVVFRSDPNLGMELGVAVAIALNEWEMAAGNVTWSYADVLSEDLQKHLAGLPLVTEYGYPAIIPDRVADMYTRKVLVSKDSISNRR